MREVVMNDKSNLLQLEEHFYQLVDVDEPNTFRNLFPYEEIPKIAFNDRIVPHNMPDEIWITDTTFRDGQQSRAPYTTEQIVTIYDYLHKLGGPKGKIRQSEFFLYSKKDRDAVYKCMERGYQFPEVTSWIRASKQDFQLVKDLGLRETGILVSCSDYHIFYKMKMTRREVMNLYLSVIRDCLELAVLAPNSCNLQPWSFQVVRDPALLARLHPVCMSQNAAKAPLIIVVIADVLLVGQLKTANEATHADCYCGELDLTEKHDTFSHTETTVVMKDDKDD